MQVSVYELKNHLSQYLHKGQEGEKVIVTSHRVPLAISNPIPAAITKKIGLKKIFQLENVEWNGKKPKGVKQGLKIRGKTVAEMVLEDRR
jgi:antitoxin (DNA-binding transcriptional repressor) of toxin-antitoxin stability system